MERQTQLVRKTVRLFMVLVIASWLALGTAPSLASSYPSSFVETSSSARDLTPPSAPQLAPPSAPQPGPTFTVNTPADPGLGICDVTSCSLRAAITAANAGGMVGVHSIDFNLTYPVTITLGSELPVITGTLTILGPGASSLAVSGNGLYRIFQVSSGAKMTVNNLAMRKGYNTFDGAGILNDHGTITVTNSLFQNGLSSAEGGGISNQAGTAVISGTTFLDNDSFHDGGIFNSGTMTVTHSTFTGNHARIGGALTNTGVMTILGSTFSENVGEPGTGGAISNGGTLTIANSTFFHNGSTAGGAISNGGGTIHITNSTFAENFASPGGAIANTGASGLVVLKNSLLLQGVEGTNCSTLGGATTTAGADTLATDASCNAATVKTAAELALGPLQMNGGPTATMALLSGSAAINAGNDTACTAAVGTPGFGAGGVDQRGVTRPQGPHCDVGAYERPATVFVFFPVIRKGFVVP